MATFNSAQNGNWNTDATWAEAGHPTANDDVTIITHDVTYDVGVSAVTWGNCTLNSGGILIFPIGANSKMLFNIAGKITINSGGELRAGTNGAPIGGGFLCQLHWPQGSLGRYVLVLNNGGTISVYGDPTYYGSAKTAILESQWAAGGGLTLYVEGDYSAKWAAGQYFIIHDFASYGNYNTDAESFEIDSVGAYDAGNDRTPIVVTAAGDSDTFLVGAKLWMLSRNVELADPGSPWAVYGFGSCTERLRFDNNQDIARGASSNVNFNEAIFKGWEISAFGGDGLTCDGAVYLNNHHALYNNIYSVLTNCLIASCYYGTNGSSMIELGADIIACYDGLSSGNRINFTGDIISCYNAVKVANTNIIGNIYSSNNGVYAVVDISLIGNIENCNYGLVTVENMRMVGDIKGCTSGAYTSKSLSQIGSITGCGNAINNPAGVLKFKNGELSGNTNDVVGLISTIDLRAAIFEEYTIGGTKRELEIYANAGNILCWHNGDAHWQAPPSGEDFILEMLPNSYCNVTSAEWLSLIPDPLNMMFAYVTSGAKTLTFKIYPVDWASSLDQDDLQLEAFYFTGAGIERARIVNSSETYANADWRNMTVSFTQGQDGIVYFAIHLKKHEAGCYVLIDPEWSVS